MTNTVKILRSTTAGSVPPSLVSGQIAINEKDGKIFWLDTTSGQIVSATIKDLDAVLAAKVAQTDPNGAANLPAGTTAQRPATGVMGQIRFNSTTGKFEGHNGTLWDNLASAISAAVGGGSDHIFYNNDQTITQSYTIPSGVNSMSVGPITAADGIVVTGSDGSTWSII